MSRNRENRDYSIMFQPVPLHTCIDLTTRLECVTFLVCEIELITVCFHLACIPYL